LLKKYERNIKGSIGGIPSAVAVCTDLN